MVLNHSHIIPGPPLLKSLFECIQKASDKIRSRMAGKQENKLLVADAEHEMCKNVDDQTLCAIPVRVSITRACQLHSRDIPYHQEIQHVEYYCVALTLKALVQCY